MPFGLKVAPSLFQKAMTKIFEPILHHTLVYIDDILLFSKDHVTHQKLLDHFLTLVESHSIMLFEKKSTLGQSTIEFLGMILEDGYYRPSPHIAQELLHFSDEHLTKKQIQQFLRIINYLRDFLPHLSIHTSQLFKMLKKKPGLWGLDQTSVVQRLKLITQNPLALKIPSTGQRILQTNASDEYWGTILFELIDGKELFCGHASG